MQIKGRDNIFVDSLSRLKTLGIYEANDPQELGSKYGQIYFDTISETICDVDISQDSNKEFEIKGVKYLIDEKDLDNFSSQSTDPNS